MSNAVFGITRFAEGAERLAYRLMYAMARVEEARRPVDIKAAAAEFNGMCKAANAVGFGHTETHVEMMVRGVWARYPKPPFNPTNSTPRIEWEDNASLALAAELEASK